MDVCTAVAVSIVSCLPTFYEACKVVEGRVLCTLQQGSVTCTTPPVQYQCKRPDGTIYVWTEERR